MKTYVLIPTKMPPPDPVWMQKKFSGQKLNAEEIDEFMLWKQKNKLKQLKKILKAPGMGTFEKIRKETLTKKIQCEVGSCDGWNYDVYGGIFERCGPMNPFEIWEKHVREKDFDESLDLFMDLFGCDTFHNPFGANDDIRYKLNCYFQAKYGMFTCNDISSGKWG